MEESKEIEERKNKLYNFFFGWVKDNYDKVFLIILAIAFIIRLWIFFKTLNQTVWWDGADYLATAKRLGLGLDIRDIWYYRRGFLFPLIGAIFFKIGLGEIGIRFFIILASTGIILVSYLLIKSMFNRKLALFTSLPLTASWILLFFSGRILTDIPSAFFILLALLFFWKGYVTNCGKKYLYLFALFFALAILTRMQMFMFVPPFLLFVILKEKASFVKNKQLWICFGIFLLVMAPQFVLYSMHYSNPIGDLVAHYLGISIGSQEVISGDSRGLTLGIFNYFKDLPYMLYSPIFVLFILGIFLFFIDLILGIDKIFKDPVIQNKLFVVLWIVSLFLIMGYIGAVSYVEQRYITSGLPFLFMIAVYPFIWLGEYLEKNIKISKKILTSIVILVLVLCLVPNYKFGNQLIDGKLSSYLEVKQAGEWIKQNSNSQDIILTASLPQMTYYSERSVYPIDLGGEYIQKKTKELENFSEGEEGFTKFIDYKRPRYLVLSRIEQSPDWSYNYPAKYNETVIPVKVYSDANGPVLIVYEFKYN